MDWMTKATAVAMQLDPTLDPDTARGLARELARTHELEMGAAEAVYRFFKKMPPGWFAVAVPAEPSWFDDLVLG